MFDFLKTTFSSLFTQLNTKLQSLFARTTIDEQTLKELEMILISSDAGVATTQRILTNLRKSLHNGVIEKGEDLHKALEHELNNLLLTQSFIPEEHPIYLFVGINGSGKTTTIGKLAHLLHKKNKKVLLVAGDTFRAAATQQLQMWAEKTQSSIIIGKERQDPASLIFTACQEFKDKGYDCLIIDTAGRLQTKVNLMKELEKIKKTIQRQLPHAPVVTLLTIDAMLGQNSFEQAKTFNESTQVNGVVLTKMDGTAKGGIVFAINQELHIPITFISFGENFENLKVFKAQEFVKQILENPS